MWKLRKIQKLKTILLQRPKQLQLLKGKPQQMRRVLTEEQAGFPGPDWYIQAQLARQEKKQIINCDETLEILNLLILPTTN